MEYKINTKLKTLDKIINFFTFKKSERVKGYCGHCGNPIFKLDNKWCKMGLCVYCWEMINFNTKNPSHFCSTTQNSLNSDLTASPKLKSKNKMRSFWDRF